MFPDLPRRDPGAEPIGTLASTLVRSAGSSGNNRTIPAGYTYLGQFLDHDITFDPTSKLQRDNDPSALVNFRTPRFDLDSVYGSGPADQPFLYDWDAAPAPGVKLLVDADPPDAAAAGLDLPRNHQHRALIGDARNDENLIIAQLHLLFLRFHNRVVDVVDAARPSLAAAELLEEAQRIVRWHYQWIVMHDFLPRIVGHPLPDEHGAFAWRDEPFMPVEFSGAAFRFGHSMVRESYKLNDGPAVPVFRPRRRSGRHLGGARRLPRELEIDWERFFRLAGARPPTSSMQIDLSLSEALSELPDGTALARRNLERGRALGLPAGRDVANAMGEEPLTDDELLDPLPRRLDPTTREAMLHATPLWYYVLLEAQLRGGEGEHLGPVGGRIVAEVMVGLLEGDPQSYRRQWPEWTPELPGATAEDFTMGDLVHFTLDGEE
ncbi:MAG TPA: heme peroxidase family protein [Baekduia sp.]|uniref:peroxidase family protein n=1 Tax=Baekduia sp. TaxID=2600305 RepID=UPI002CC618CF|nr:heme peroxidase family protein [Baekduia sp.]HMJ36713.1 heme peroxidase family protein [Baekduia sp.]